MPKPIPNSEYISIPTPDPIPATIEICPKITEVAAAHQERFIGDPKIVAIEVGSAHLALDSKGCVWGKGAKPDGDGADRVSG